MPTDLAELFGAKPAATAGTVNVLSPHDAELQLHPAVELFPAMSADQRAALKADIEQHGVRQPILLYRGKLADGRHRHGVARELGLPCPAVEFCGTEQELLTRIMSANFHRRHLSGSERAAIAVKLKTEHGIDLPTEALGKLTGVSGRHVRTAAKLAEVSPEHLDRVAAGELTLPEAVRAACPPVDAVANGAEPRDHAPAEIHRDCLGHELPPDLVPVFASLPLAGDIEKNLKAALRGAKELCEVAAGVFIDKPGLYGDIRNAIKEIQAKRPYTVCPGCEGRGCHQCDHNGWMGESRFKQFTDQEQNDWIARGKADLAKAQAA